MEGASEAKLITRRVIRRTATLNVSVLPPLCVRVSV